MEFIVSAVMLICFGVIAVASMFYRVPSTLQIEGGDWASRYGFSPNEDGDLWTAQIMVKPGVEVNLSVRFMVAGGARVLAIEAKMPWSESHARVRVLSAKGASNDRSGHPTLSRWYRVEGDDAKALAHLSDRAVAGLLGLKECEPSWTSVEGTSRGLECTHEPDKLTEGGLAQALAELVPPLEACARAWPEAAPLEDALDARLRDEGEPESVRWRAMRLLLTRYPDSDQARGALADVASWPEEVRIASVIWSGPSRDMSEDEGYEMCRDASASGDAELAAGAAWALSRREPWRALTDARVVLAARVKSAGAALGDARRPQDAERLDAALVGVLTGLLSEEPARVAMYEALMGAGWEPSDGAGVKLAERGTPALTEAMVAWLQAHGPTGDTRATFDALRAQGFTARVDAALERASIKGMLSVSGDATSGGLSESVGESGALSAPD